MSACRPMKQIYSNNQLLLILCINTNSRFLAVQTTATHYCIACLAAFFQKLQSVQNVAPRFIEGTENAGLETWDQIAGVEKAGLENAGTSCAWVAKCNIINVRGHLRINVTAGRGDPRTLQEATQSVPL